MRRDGYSQGGRQRWRCLTCRRRYVTPRPRACWAHQQIWFRRWLRHGLTIDQLRQHSGLSAWTLRRVIRYWLEHPPGAPGDLSRHRHLVVDGSFVYGRRVGVVVFIDGITREVISGCYGLQEGEAAMIDVCQDLRRRGLEPVSVTLDGNPQLAKMLRAVWPEVILQRCLVHVYWQGRRWCRAKPKRPEARELRQLFSQVLRVRTTADRDQFIDQWAQWENRYGQQIAGAHKWGWVVSDLRSARSMLSHALPDMFHYLDHPAIPTTTNAAEGFFGRLKQNYARHRGLAAHRRPGYFAWYFHLCR